ncbi:unnamed protein product, partial [Amoebophrya sp. A25]
FLDSLPTVQTAHEIQDYRDILGGFTPTRRSRNLLKAIRGNEFERGNDCPEDTGNFTCQLDAIQRSFPV